MVVFTCNACGSSVKKNQVEKHYQFECPRCEVLSCMDCGKDFYGDEYASHTKCISEAEKYQGTLFKETGSGGLGKGEKKQQEWLERVQGLVAAGTKVSPKISRLLERVSHYPNIPRKKSKFENFVKNSINVYDHQTLKELWDIFSSAIKPASNSDTTTEMSDESQHKKKEYTQETDSGCKEGEATCALNETDTGEISVTKDKSKHKKKKRKREKEIEIDPTTELNDDDDTSQAAKSVSSREKKRKKKHKLGTESSTNIEKLGEEANDEPCEKPPEDSGPLVTCELGMEPIPVAKKKKRTKSEVQVEELVVADEKSLVEEGELVISSKAGSKVSSSPVEVALEYINGCQPHGEERNDLEHDGNSKKKKEKKRQRTEAGSDGDVTSKKIKRESKEKLKKHKKHKH